MKMKGFLVSAALTSLWLWAGCGPSAQKSVQIKGSDTMVNLVQILAEEFMERNPEASIAVLGGGSGTGIVGLINGTCDIANHSRDIKEEEYTRLHEKNIDPRTFVTAIDGLSVIVHATNPVTDLTIDQIGAVYRGEIVNWNELGGPDIEISLYGRQSNSGTYVFFQEHVLDNQDYSADMKEMNGNAQIVEGIINDRAGIGYVGIGYVKAPETGLPRTDLSVLNVSKTAGAPVFSPLDDAAVDSGDYPIARALYQTTPGVPTGTAARFLEFIFSPDGQAVVKREGFFAPGAAMLRKNLSRLR